MSVTKKKAGPPKKAKFGDADSIREKVQREFEKFDIKLANSLPELLEAYYNLGMDGKSGETTRRTVIKELIDRSESKLEEVAANTEQVVEEEEEEVVEISLISTSM